MTDQEYSGLSTFCHELEAKVRAEMMGNTHHPFIPGWIAQLPESVRLAVRAAALEMVAEIDAVTPRRAAH